MSDEDRFLQLVEALRLSEHRFRALYDNNANAVLIVDREGIILDANPAAYRIGGRTQDEVIGQHFIAPRNEAHWQRLKGFFDRALAGESVSFDTTSVTRSGASLDLEAMIVPQLTDGTVSGAFIVLQDVTARKTAETHAERQAEHIRDLYFIAISGDSESRLHATLAMGARIFNAVTGAIVDTRAAPPALEVRYDSGESSVSDETLLQTAAAVPETGAAIAETDTGFGLQLFIGSEPYGVLVFECANSRNHRLDAADRDLLALMAVLLGSALERRRNRAQLRTLAYFDALTGLPNRPQVQERLREAISNAQASGTHVAVLFFDLDRFKDINDTLGHALGDRLLQMVAQRLVDIAGSLGTIARTGGDEFVIVLPGCAEVES
ncbi:MAG: sensor domain-containing diguanylate cyclase, partial [Candidatus Eremiobacteraeota bacterium]|nr:sensor domain-containing diguanylate cyclase [Candidatus Eremiobacteraeota bacterium]